jgi:BirA family biotin operon repressor/biotin-[acetyl-CoA-carboxylase] ligase
VDGLDARAEAAGHRLISHSSLGSTMDEAVRLARSDEAGPLWIAAGRQTAGRGRHGRVWASEPGNLYATLLLTDPCAPEQAPQLGFVAGLALADALAAVAPLGGRARLKWPNDVLVGGAKLAGILLESVTHPPRGLSVAVGFGVNVAHHPADLPYRATSLAAEGEGATAGDLLRELAAAFAGRLAQWRAGEHFPAIRQDWLARAAGLGGVIDVRLQNRSLRGIFRDIDFTGRLALETADGVQFIDAGDVMLRPEAA